MYQGKIFINSLFAFFPQESKTMYHKRKVKCKLVICLTSSAAISTNDSPCFQERESFLSFSFLLPSNVKPINFFPSLYSLLCQMSAIIILNSNSPPSSGWWKKFLHLTSVIHWWMLLLRMFLFGFSSSPTIFMLPYQLHAIFFQISFAYRQLCPT